jgi:hypothetical protein
MRGLLECGNFIKFIVIVLPSVLTKNEIEAETGGGLVRLAFPNVWAWAISAAGSGARCRGLGFVLMSGQ